MTVINTKRIRSGRDRKVLFSIAFLAPALVLYCSFIIFPIFSSAYYSLLKWNGVGAAKYIGLRNFERLFQDPDYWTSFFNTVKAIIICTAFQIPLGLIFAFLLYNTQRGYKFFRSVFFLPVVISPTAIGTMFLLFFNGELGPLNYFLKNIGLDALAMNWLSDKRTVLYCVIFPAVWQYIGYYCIIFLAGMQSISEEIFESARIDGASSFQVFTRMVLPMLYDLITVCVVLCVTGSIKAFDQAYVMTAGGPGVQSSYIAIFMYHKAFTDTKLGEGTAVGITMLLFSLLFTLTFKKLTNKESIDY